MQVPASGVCANHLRQTYAVTSSTRGWKSFPPWARLQNLGMNLYSSLLTKLSINLVWTKPTSSHKPNLIQNFYEIAKHKIQCKNKVFFFFYYLM